MYSTDGVMKVPIVGCSPSLQPNNLSASPRNNLVISSLLIHLFICIFIKH
jgi:hypothetical protein